MVGNYQTFVKGGSINWSSLFTKENYPFWEVRMRIFLEWVDRGVWDAIVNGPYIPNVVVDEKEVEKDFNSWTMGEN